jgi:hypothetical protein
MPYPLSIDGSFHLTVTSGEMLVPLVVEKTATMLSELSAEQVFVDDSTVRFRSGLSLDRWNWHLLSLVGSGRVFVKAKGEGLTVSFQLSQIGLLLWMAVMVAFLLIASWPVSWPILFLLPFLAAVQVVQYATTYVWFSNWLQHGLEDMPQIRRHTALA